MHLRLVFNAFLRQRRSTDIETEVMGGVNTARSYVDIMKFGHWNDATNSVVIDKPTLQGGIVGGSLQICCPC